ncbi:hypothetical protein JKP88DRAFT_327727 [Tribonema minus]|uniref:Uncharacterized protein n=1 Tax=Tribonema minus TaxID=303371 RepID=A0A835YT16_9STRA|nr:hypothetical protein JKP88DRAFT_327727 [Tribonema minus]
MGRLLQLLGTPPDDGQPGSNSVPGRLFDSDHPALRLRENRRGGPHQHDAALANPSARTVLHAGALDLRVPRELDAARRQFILPWYVHLALAEAPPGLQLLAHPQRPPLLHPLHPVARQLGAQHHALLPAGGHGDATVHGRRGRHVDHAAVRHGARRAADRAQPQARAAPRAPRPARGERPARLAAVHHGEAGAALVERGRGPRAAAGGAAVHGAARAAAQQARLQQHRRRRQQRDPNGARVVAHCCAAVLSSSVTYGRCFELQQWGQGREAGTVGTGERPRGGGVYNFFGAIFSVCLRGEGLRHSVRCGGYDDDSDRFSASQEHCAAPTAARASAN